MKATITIKKEVDVRYMKVDAGVLYEVNEEGMHGYATEGCLELIKEN